MVYFDPLESVYSQKVYFYRINSYASTERNF